MEQTVLKRVIIYKVIMLHSNLAITVKSNLQWLGVGVQDEMGILLLLSNDYYIKKRDPSYQSPCRFQRCLDWIDR